MSGPYPRLVAIALATLWISSMTLGATLTDPVTGKPVVIQPGKGALHIVFFATWCPTCMEELPRLGEIEARWGTQGYRLVLVASSWTWQI